MADDLLWVAGVGLDPETGGLRSLRSRSGRELLDAAARAAPTFRLRCMSPGCPQARELTSADARSAELLPREDRTSIRYRDLAGGGVHVTVSVRALAGFAYWSLTLTAERDTLITELHFPYLLVPYRSDRGPVRVVEPLGYGKLHTNPRPQDLSPDAPVSWDLNAGPAYFAHYPGTTFSQFLAWYDDDAGVYLGCEDPYGTPKLLKPVHRQSAIRLGAAHLIGWQGPGTVELDYEIAVGPFEGDWHDAADIYRQWWQRAHPDVQPLADRSTIPGWVLDSPLHAVLRIRGEVDAGPAVPHSEFTPYQNALPLLDRLARQVGGPVLPVLMGWERPGPWIYPDSFPPVGGNESLRAFSAAARDRGWHVGTYCNGTQWVTGHDWTSYNGTDYYAAQGGEEAVCRDAAGRPVANVWDQGWLHRPWRHSYTCCVAAPRTQDVAAGYVRELIGLGLDWIQFLDQNCGGASFGCYSGDHGHAPAPGRWMTKSMATLLDRLDLLAAGHHLAFSVESAIADNMIGRFAGSDLRPDYCDSDIPLYAYLFHDYVLSHATFAPAPPPYATLLRTAQAFVMGDLPGVILGPGGRILDGAANPWPAWDGPLGNQPAILAFLRRTLALRRGDGKRFLLLGRLCRDAAVTSVNDIQWLHEEKLYCRPAVLAARWISPSGESGTALANWTDTDQPVTVALDPAARAVLKLHDGTVSQQSFSPASSRRLDLPPFSAALLTQPAGWRSREDSH